MNSNLMKVLSVILIILGMLLVLSAIVFKILHWPDLFYGMISGPILLGTGIIVLTLKKKAK